MSQFKSTCTIRLSFRTQKMDQNKKIVKFICNSFYFRQMLIIKSILQQFLRQTKNNKMHQNTIQIPSINPQTLTQRADADNNAKMEFILENEQYHDLNSFIRKADDQDQFQQNDYDQKKAVGSLRFKNSLQQFNQFLECQFPQSIESSSQLKSDSNKSKSVQRQKKQKQRHQNRCLFKNYLIVIKRCISALLARQETNILPEQAKKLIDQRACTNKKQIEQIFNWESIRPEIALLFMQKRIFREIQCCRLSRDNRQIFRDKLRLLKKAFILGRLPNL